VYILRLDSEGKRIGLSLKRLQPNPWSIVEEMYHVGQLVQGTVSRTAQFGAFISLEPGIEALLHVSQIGDGTVQDATQVIKDGDVLTMRIISIEADKQRLGLSLRDLDLDTPVANNDAETELVETITEEVQAVVTDDTMTTA
jgi:small subunit ribosomal protein S1